MVAVIKAGSSLRRPFHYNENKVADGVANRILAENFPLSIDKLNAEDSLRFLIKQASQNSRSRVNAVHISLNFSPGETLGQNVLEEISRAYMEGIGFGNQPYLVYQHHDAGHPHLHIISTNIQLDGKRISLHNIGKEKSEPVRKGIEKQFGLIRAEDQKRQLYIPEPLLLKQVEYGKSETKRAIGNVLQHVLQNYKFTSLPELNAVLRCYNIAAERGSEESRVFKHKGLYFRILDPEGNKVGIPIKSSLFAFKATLPSIEAKYMGNEMGRQKYAGELKTAIDRGLVQIGVKNIPDLIKSLHTRGITMVLRENNEGRIYGITYVDHRHRTVFNGSALGKKYSSKGLADHLGSPNSPTGIQKNEKEKNASENRDVLHLKGKDGPVSGIVGLLPETPSNGIGEILLSPEQGYSHVPFEWKKRRKKKKKKIKKP
jgi:hypothetical protein